MSKKVYDEPMKRSTLILAGIMVLLLLIVGGGVSALMTATKPASEMTMEEKLTVGAWETPTEVIYGPTIERYEVTTIPWETEQVMVATIESIRATMEIEDKTSTRTPQPTPNRETVEAIFATIEAAN